MGNDTKFKRLGIVGAGNMGTMMSLGFAEQGFDVSLWDISGKNLDQAKEMFQNERKERAKIDCFHDIGEFTDSLKECEHKLFLFSITHGPPADSVLDKIKDKLQKGDIILDGGNEHYRRTERRQKELEPMGVHWVGMGVSGGYQSARRGPSMSPGGSKEAIESVLPVLEKFAAKDSKGNPCVAYIGPRGAGHYVKMCHNGMKRIGSEICQRKKTREGDGKGEGVGDSGYVLDDVLDKVVQDDDNSEGTCFWTVIEAADRHVSAPTLAVSQFFRVASGDRDQRLRVAAKLKVPQPKKGDVENKEAFIEELRRAVYASFLCAFCQGLELIARASKDEGWHVNLGTCLKIWRAGCIIKSDYIADMLQPILSEDTTIMNMKLIGEVSSELHKHYEPLKKVVMKGLEWDNNVPSLSASLEYLKIVGGKMLPTQFMEAQMDFFGAHAYDKPGQEGEDPGKATKGAHHYEWRPA